MPPQSHESGHGNLEPESSGNPELSQADQWATLNEYQQALDQVLVPHADNEIEWQQWQNDLKRERGIPTTQRTLSQVAESHSMTADELKELCANRTVIDLGAGDSYLAAQLRGQNVTERAMALDLNRPNFDSENSLLHHLYLQGDMAAIPLRPSSFDVVIATWSLPYWAHSVEQLQQFQSEAIALLKPGGVLLITPTRGIVSRPRFDRELQQSVSIEETNPYFLAVLKALDQQAIAWLKQIRNDPQYEILLRSTTAMGPAQAVRIRKLIPGSP